MQFALLAPLTAASYIGGVNLGGGVAHSPVSWAPSTGGGVRILDPPQDALTRIQKGRV